MEHAGSFTAEREHCYIREASANDGFIECKVPAFGGVISYKGVAARTNRPVERDREKPICVPGHAACQTRTSNAKDMAGTTMGVSMRSLLPPV